VSNDGLFYDGLTAETVSTMKKSTGGKGMFVIGICRLYAPGDMGQRDVTKSGHFCRFSPGKVLAVLWQEHVAGETSWQVCSISV
jgi:hypothetical protein